MEVLHEARLNSNCDDGESSNLPCLSFDSYLYDDSNFQFEFKYVITIISAKRISKLVACGYVRTKRSLFTDICFHREYTRTIRYLFDLAENSNRYDRKFFFTSHLLIYNL